MELSKTGSGKVRVDWKKGETMAAWPQKVPVENPVSGAKKDVWEDMKVVRALLNESA